MAELSSRQIARLTKPELVRVIRSVEFSLPQPGIDERLDRLDRATLQQLAYLARRCCRNQGY